MSAALKSYLPQPIPTRSRREKRFVSFRTSQLDQGSAALVVPEKVQSAPQESRPVPLVPPASGTTQLLSKLQLVSSVLTGALVGLALVSYGVSVYVDRQLDQATRRLTQLQRSEQQLTTVNEVLKNYMAQQAEATGTGLIPPTPEHVIFLRPAQQRSHADSVTPDHSPSDLPRMNRPMGY